MPDPRTFIGGQLGHALIGQQLLHEGAVAGGDQLLRIGFRLRLTVVGGGDDDIDAVGAAIDMVVDPAQLLLQMLGREGGGTCLLYTS